MAYLTAASLAPPDAIKLAAALGYDAVGLRITASAPGGAFAPLMEDKALLRETQRALADTGIEVFDIEIVRINERFAAQDFLPFLDVCAQLNARAVLVAGDDPDEARLTQSFAQFCTMAATYGVSGNLEFMPWTAVKDCKSALRIVERAGPTNGKVLVDALHVARSATTLLDLSNIPASRLAYAQVCDAPAAIPKTDAELIFAARSERLLPGEGGIDLAGIVSRLPFDLPLSVEIPSDKRITEVGVREWARMALAATREVLRSTGTG